MGEPERSSNVERCPCSLLPSLCDMAALASGCQSKADTHSVWLYNTTAKSNAQPLLPQMSIFHLNWDKAKKLEYCLIMHSKSARVENNGELIRSLKLIHLVLIRQIPNGTADQFQITVSWLILEYQWPAPERSWDRLWALLSLWHMLDWMHQCIIWCGIWLINRRLMKGAVLKAEVSLE